MSDQETSASPTWGLLGSVVALVVAILVGALALWEMQPPAPKPENAPPAEFSAVRAHKHLEAMCVETHPTGSQAAMRVRQYIEQTVREMGYEPELHKAYVQDRNDRPPFKMCYIENVIVRVPGTASTGAFLNMAHYDSVPYGLGASDDGAGCASMLEVLRALKHLPPVKNDLIFLFTDGEEAGLLGPKAFLKHPYCKDVKAVLNYEARGYYGPSLMFELSDENGWIIEQVAQAATKPIASSVMFDAAGRMPTTTDYEILKRAGYPGMGLAYVGGIEYYHTANDSPEKISLHSLQHHGEYGLPLDMHFGNIDFAAAQLRAPNKVYFNILGGWLVSYPQEWLPILTALCVLLVLGALLAGVWRDAFTLPGVLAGALVHVVAIVITATIVGVVMYGGYMLNQEYVLYRTYTYLFGYSFLTLCVYALALRVAARRVSVSAIAAGALLLWVPILFVTGKYVTGGSYIAMWPMAGAAVGLAVVWLAGDRLPKFGAPLITLLGALPALLIITPLMYLSVISITIIPSSFWMANLVLLLSVLCPVLVALVKRSGLIVPAAAAGVAVPLLLLATFGIRFTAETPKMTHFCYGMNCTTGEAFWLSKETELDDWLSKFFSSPDQRGRVDDIIYGQEGEFLRAPAPAMSEGHPEVTVLGDEVKEGMRHLKIRVASPRKAARLDVAIDPTVDIFAAAVNEMPMGSDDGTPQKKGDRAWRLRYQGLSYEGIVLDLKLTPGVPMPLVVRETSFGVPPIPGITIPARPANNVSRNNVVQFWDGDRERFQSNALYTMKEFVLPANL